jgi:PhzF family phenazine biosynthesis protein
MKSAMKKTLQCRVFEVNAFTRDRAGGNPAGVVLDADGLSDEQMREIAHSLPAPDTAFVFKPTAPDHDAHLRFLTPRREAPFIGHATIAAHYVRAKIDGQTRAKQRQLTGMGLMDIEIPQAAGDFRVTITQPAPVLGPMLPKEHHAQVLAALGLSAEALHPRYPLQRVGEKAPRLLIGVRSAEILDGLKPDFDSLKRLSPEVGADGYFVFALEEDGPAASTHARLFCPAMGIPEDPVSGNTHAMLAVYLVHHGMLVPQEGKARFRGYQGAWVGRPGIIEVEAICEGRKALAVRILGDAVITRAGVWP